MLNLNENVFNLNYNWKFKKPTVPFPLADAALSMKKSENNFFNTNYDDSDWETVSLPHAPNAADSFDSLIRDSGEATLYRGFMFYRKAFTLDNIQNKKLILEFEAIRQSAYLYINGSFVGYYEAGTAPIGFDITPFAKNGENLLALATDNAAYRECEFTTLETVPGNPPGDLSGERYQWNQKDFNEVQGGITGNVHLYITGLIYQTRPLYNNLKTTGNYIYPSAFDFEQKRVKINVKAEVRNESGVPAQIKLETYILDGENIVAHFSSEDCSIPPASDKGIVLQTVVPSDAYSENPSPTNADTVSVSYITSSHYVSPINFWSPDSPYLYDVYTLLTSNGEIIDIQKTTTGFREVKYSIENGLTINGKNLYLKGYAQRSTNEWAVIGVANDHLTDFDMMLVRESNANYIRWMHVTPKPVAIRSGDKYGIVSVCPAGDKETDVTGRQWDMRVEAMRDAIIYFRNSPSVIFYEAGNNAITPTHMQEMTSIKNLLDPFGYRFMGCRTLTTPEQMKASEWAGTMVYRYDSTAKAAMAQTGRFIPMLETEYKRDESPRRVWDDYSPPYYDYKNKWLGDGAKKTDGFDVWDQTQEDFAVFAASDTDGYAYFYNNRINGSTGNNYYSGAAIMVWSDSNMHGRNSGSENCRTTGKVDPVRIKKQAFHALSVMQAEYPMVHIIGHWNYLPDTNENYNYHTKIWNGTYWEETETLSRRNPHDKTVYVVASEACFKVELYINGILSGSSDTPTDNYIYPFPHIDITQSGTIKAVAYNENGDIIATHKLETADKPEKITLIPHTGPKGLIADGSDICFFDVLITDKHGNICPLAYDKIDFSLEGDGIFLGGYNSGTFDATSVIHKNYCYAECGTNRVFVKSIPFGESFTLTATAENLSSCAVTVSLTPIEIINGMSINPQQAFEKNSYQKKTAATISGRKFNSRENGVNRYFVTVNNKEPSFSTPPYRPDSATGVLCPLRPVLDMLKVKYTYNNQHGKTVLTLTDTNAIITEGETVIYTNGDSNLTNAEFYVKNGELIGEISAVLSYINNITLFTDPDKKLLTIQKVSPTLFGDSCN